MILLQVDHVSRDEDCYEMKDTSVFTWFSILGIRHYRWLRGLIHRLPPNNKVDYLVCTIWHILDFLQLWIIIVT
jgi:hypothetical protein